MMKNLIIFLSGAAIGGAVVWFYQERKYESLINEEIESVKEAFKHEEPKKEEVSDVSETLKNIASEAVNKPSVSEIYQTTLEQANYIKYNKKEDDEDKKPEKKEKEIVEKPYIIDQGDFKEFRDYNHVTLDYYKDGVLTDADFPNDPIDDISEIVGDCLKSLDMEALIEDWVYIRNDSKKCDYEIFINDIKFSELEREE